VTQTSRGWSAKKTVSSGGDITKRLGGTSGPFGSGTGGQPANSIDAITKTIARNQEIFSFISDSP
jgi:hypothetical protein